jgi:hypothetical protein
MLLKLKYIKIYIFINSLFANNKDLTLQLGFIIILAIEISYIKIDFKIFRNIIH